LVLLVLLHQQMVLELLVLTQYLILLHPLVVVVEVRTEALAQHQVEAVEAVHTLVKQVVQVLLIKVTQVVTDIAMVGLLLVVEEAVLLQLAEMVLILFMVTLVLD
jgi:hypothetical protein